MKTVTYDETQWKLVPKEPNQEMEDNGIFFSNKAFRDDCGDESINMIYRGMIAAAPPYAESNCKEILDSWIPCSERLPDQEGYFDVFIRSSGASIYNSRQADVLYCHSRWQAALQYGQHVSHWMPIPAAPKGEE